MLRWQRGRAGRVNYSVDLLSFAKESRTAGLPPRYHLSAGKQSLVSFSLVVDALG